MSGNVSLEGIGFYVAWHAFGGFDGVQKAFGFSRSGMYRRLRAFRREAGLHPDEAVMPGVVIVTRAVPRVRRRLRS